MRVSRGIRSWCCAIVALGLVAGIGCSTAQAATGTAILAVSATVLSLCAIAAVPLVFGNYSSTASLDTSATIAVTCTASTPFNISLDAGVSSGATVATRKMSFGSSTLSYSLYTDPSRTVNWGQTVGTDTVASVGNGLPQLLTVYGRIPANQFVNPGIYTDVITATITY